LINRTQSIFSPAERRFIKKEKIMKKVSTGEFRTNLKAILDAVEAGKTVWIKRPHGKRVKIVAEEKKEEEEKEAEEAAAEEFKI